MIFTDDYGALEPSISGQIMELHHSKHHATYVNSFNTAEQQLEEARQYKMRGFNRLTPGDRNNVIDLHAIKENISQGAPVVIGMQVGGSYMQPMMGKDLWEPTQEDRAMIGFGGHAQCVVAYDDSKYGGAFLIMNEVMRKTTCASPRAAAKTIRK